MKIRIKILTLLFISLFSLQSFAMINGNTIYPDAEIQPESEHQSAIADALNLLFSAHHQSERTAHLSNANLLQSAESLTKKDANKTHPSEKIQSWQVAKYLDFSSKVEVSLTVKKLIFPFHSYL